MLPNAEELVRTLGPLAAFVVATFDRSGLPIILGSVCVAVGIVNGNQTLTILLGTLGMISGDLFLYELGRRGGTQASFSRRLLKPLRPLQATARAILRKFPSASLIFGRYVAGAGIILPLLCGGFGMSRKRSYPLLIFGSVIYVLPWGILAFYLGRRFEPIVNKFQAEAVWIALAGLFCVIAWFAFQQVRRKARKAAMQQNNINNNNNTDANQP
ncbi:MAG: DedA family protein [Planctomycetota bacterium]